MKFVGFTICPTYPQTLMKSWERVLRGFEKVLFLWQSRQLETLTQRVELPRILALSTVSHSMSRNFPLHQYMLETFLEAVGRGEVTRSLLKTVTTKAIYRSRMNDLLTPTKVELKYPQINLQEFVYPRLKTSTGRSTMSRRVKLKF